MADQSNQPWNQHGIMPGLHQVVLNNTAHRFEREFIVALQQRWPSMSGASRKLVSSMHSFETMLINPVVFKPILLVGGRPPAQLIQLQIRKTGLGMNECSLSQSLLTSAAKNCGTIRTSRFPSASPAGPPMHRCRGVLI